MIEHHDTPDKISIRNPLQNVVYFNEKNLISSQSTTSTSLLTSSSSIISLSFPLIAEKPGVRFKLLILFLSLFIGLIIGLILSLIFVTQFNHIPKHTNLSNGSFLTLSEQNFIKNNYLIKHLNSVFINELDFNINICEDFYGFVCRKWLINHPLSPLELKRSWLTEQSKNIRNKFGKFLANLSEIYVYNYQIENEKNNQTETEIDYYDELTSVKNELEQFYSFHDEYDNNNQQHKLVKRQLNLNEYNLSQSISNMLLYYHQCLHTSKFNLIKELQQLTYKQFWFTNNYNIISKTNHLDLLFEQMIEHPLMHIWNINTINLGTQIIIHIQKQQIQNEEKYFFLYQIEQANLFEQYIKINNINLCSQTIRVGKLSNTLKEYKNLLNNFFLLSNFSINDDLNLLITNKKSLPIIYSSIKYSNELKDFIEYLLNKDLIQSLNNTNIYNLFQNFSYDLKNNLLNIPIFRNTILYQCRLFLYYYIYFRSLNESKLESWLDYITSSIINIINYSWPGDASYICLYSTIVRHNQFEIISYWNKFISYTKKQIKNLSSPIITVEIRLIDFFQLDSIFRFLFADQYGHYCNLMIYKYGQKLLPFISIFNDEIQFNLKNLWKQILQENSKEQLNIHSFSFPSNRIPNDCLTLLEYYYPFTLSSYYEEYMLNKTNELYSIAYKLRDIFLNNSNNQYLSSIEFHIKPERLKLYHDISSTTLLNIPYEYYFIEDNYLSTSWNIIENFQEKLIEPIYDFFEINAHHTIEQGIFLQPTIAELYSNKTTRLISILLIAHELGHALCPCRINITEREYYADLIALRLILNLNQTFILNDLKNFFILYGQSECIHINREMIFLMNKNENLINFHINRILKENEQFKKIFNCSLNQIQQINNTDSLLPELCSICRKKKELKN